MLSGGPTPVPRGRAAVRLRVQHHDHKMSEVPDDNPNFPGSTPLTASNMEAEKNEGLRDAELGNHHVMGRNLEPQGPQPRRHVFSQAAISVFHHFLNIL